VAMGRAMVRRPGIFLMDEPLSNLDSGLRAELRAEISSMTRELGVTTMYVTHDQAEALTMADRVAIMRKGVLQDLGTPTEVYRRPATLYTAAFLGSPKMNLLEAAVYVHLDRYIALSFGEQILYLPWSDPRARAVARYHGERIVVGIRAEALTPVTPDTQGHVFQGRIRFLEHHGHESLAYLDVGATAIVVDEIGAAVTDDGRGGAGSAFKRLGGALQRLARPGSSDIVAPEGQGGVATDPGRHHRKPAELAVRLAPYPQVAPGHPLAVSVRMEAVHFFDQRGDRIDVGWR
jgi:multiple sugar transport system ATP-binding protein